MLSTLPGVAGATRSAVFPDAGTPAGTVVLSLSDLRVHGSGSVSAEGAAPSAGELAVFCRPVMTAPAVVRRDGTVLAGAWLPDLVRLGELERHPGDGVIEAIVGAELDRRRLRPRQRRRIMSYPLVIRLMIAMTLMPDASCGEAPARLAGLLADVPFALDWHVPTGKVITEWRLLIPAGVTEEVFWHAAGPLAAGDEASAVTRSASAASVRSLPHFRWALARTWTSCRCMYAVWFSKWSRNHSSTQGLDNAICMSFDRAISSASRSRGCSSTSKMHQYWSKAEPRPFLASRRSVRR